MVAMLAGIVAFILGGVLTVEDRIAQLRSDDPKIREEAVREILRTRQEMIADIENVVRDFKGDDARESTVKVAITLLGKLRSIESLPLLVDSLTFFSPETKSIRNPDSYFPCINALIEIGYPAVDPLLKKVKESDDEDAMRCAAFTLKRMLGKTVAALCIQSHAERQLDVRKRARLFALQKYLDKWPELDK